MKAFIFTGVILMFAACIYGFADFSKQSGKKEMKELYDETPVEEKVSVSDTKEPVEATVVEKPTALRKNSVRKAVVAVPKEEEVILKENKVAAEILPENLIEINPEEELKENENGKKIGTAKKTKRVRTKMFSRAPLEEKYIERDVKRKKG